MELELESRQGMGMRVKPKNIWRRPVLSRRSRLKKSLAIELFSLLKTCPNRSCCHSVGSEACRLTLNDEQKLAVFERKVIRAIYGSVFEPNDRIKMRSNHEIRNILANDADIIA
jgi:hypothetical protein